MVSRSLESIIGKDGTAQRRNQALQDSHGESQTTSEPLGRIELRNRLALSSEELSFERIVPPFADGHQLRELWFSANVIE